MVTAASSFQSVLDFGLKPGGVFFSFKSFLDVLLLLSRRSAFFSERGRVLTAALVPLSCGLPLIRTDCDLTNTFAIALGLLSGVISLRETVLFAGFILRGEGGLGAWSGSMRGLSLRLLLLEAACRLLQVHSVVESIDCCESVLDFLFSFLCI